MGIQKWLLFLFLHIHIVPHIVAQLPNLLYYSCGENDNYTENSAYQKNLDSLVSSLSSKIDKYGFYYDSIGQNTDKVSGIVLCRGDVQLEECRNCVNNIAQKLVQKRKRKLVDKIQGTLGDDISDVESLQYDFLTIREATNNFSNANKLGQGGFGPVYKGKLPNGQEVAVKRLSADSGQGDLEFKNEVLLVARLQHRNLVKLLGFCLDGTERLLVYEFVPNASLDQFLFDQVKRSQLDWERRSKIIGGIARGIVYLHEDSRLRIIHRDLKASNVLLDAEMNPKIADFGMAKLFTLDETQGNTNRIVGTYGYMAPEYAMQGQFSVKSDVYSFGVIVLEIISGQRNICSRKRDSVKDLLSYAWSNWREETISNVIDPMLRGSVDDMMRYIHIALLCVQENIDDRPNMSAVLLMLSGRSLSLPEPHNDVNPQISHFGDCNSRISQSSKLICSLGNQDLITDLYPR